MFVSVRALNGTEGYRRDLNGGHGRTNHTSPRSHGAWTPPITATVSDGALRPPTSRCVWTGASLAGRRTSSSDGRENLRRPWLTTAVCSHVGTRRPRRYRSATTAPPGHRLGGREGAETCLNCVSDHSRHHQPHTQLPANAHGSHGARHTSHGRGGALRLHPLRGRGPVWGLAGTPPLWGAVDSQDSDPGAPRPWA